MGEILSCAISLSCQDPGQVGKHICAPNSHYFKRQLGVLATYVWFLLILFID